MSKINGFTKCRGFAIARLRRAIACKGMVFSALPNKITVMEENKKAPETSAPNPGLKDEKVSNKKDLLNEDPMEEKKAIERTSEDRLDEAE